MNTTRLFALLSFIIPALLVTNFTLNHFYVEGAHILDAGWFAYLASHSTHFLPLNPTFLDDKYYFALHMSFFFDILSEFYVLIWILGCHIPYAMYFCLLQGVWFGLLALASYYLFIPTTNAKFLHELCALVFSLICILNGILLSIIVFPHFEIAIPGLLLCFFALWTKGYKKLCYIPLIFGLLVREDSGLHYFGVFLVIAVYFYISHKQDQYIVWRNYFFKLSLACFAFSCCVIAAQKIIFHPAIMFNVYLGDPVFSHVTRDFLYRRLEFIIHYRGYIYAPILALFFLAYWRKDFFLALGGVVIFPWICFSLFAYSFDAGTFTWYYSFPLLIVFFWPAIENGLLNTKPFQQKTYYVLWFSSVFMIGLSFFLFSILPKNHDRCYQPYPWHFFGLQWMEHWKKNQYDLDAFLESKAKGKHFVVDTATVCLELDKIKKDEFYWAALNKSSRLDFIIFLPHSFKYNETVSIIKQQQLIYQCRIGQSDYVLATKANDPYRLCVHQHGVKSETN